MSPLTLKYSGEFDQLRRKVIERQEKVDLLCNQSERMIEDSRDFSRSTGKLVEKVLS